MVVTKGFLGEIGSETLWIEMSLRIQALNYKK